MQNIHLMPARLRLSSRSKLGAWIFPPPLFRQPKRKALQRDKYTYSYKISSDTSEAYK